MSKRMKKLLELKRKRIELKKKSPENIQKEKIRKKLDDKYTINNFHNIFYERNCHKDTYFLGYKIEKNPLDLWNYQEIITELKPSIILEVGTLSGGSSYFFHKICENLGINTKIISICHKMKNIHPKIRNISNIEFINDDIRDKIIDIKKDYPGKIFALIGDVYDINNILIRMINLRNILRKGDYLIIENSNINGHPVKLNFGDGPFEAIKKYFKLYPKDYIHDYLRELKFLMTFSVDGYLKCQIKEDIVE